MFHRVTRALLGSHASGGTSAFRSSTDPTVIESGTRIIGEISGEGGVLLQGLVDGSIGVTGAVVVGPAGRIQGGLRADEVHLEGRLEGDVHARQRFVIEASGVLEGGFQSPRLIIEEGGRLLGTCRMQEPATQRESDSARADLGTSAPVPPLSGAVEG